MIPPCFFVGLIILYMYVHKIKLNTVANINKENLKLRLNQVRAYLWYVLFARVLFM